MKLENRTKASLQKLLGLDNYLFLFSLYKIFTIKYDKRENDVFHFLNQIKTDGIILDIGANIGTMSVHFAKKFKNSQIISFEPIQQNLKTFKRVISFFNLGNVNVLEHALGNREGEIEMVMPEIDSVTMHGHCHVIDSSIKKLSKGKNFIIPITQLDTVIHLDHTNPAEKISGIKIDVEHFEWAVLEGGREVISRHKPVIYCELAKNENRTKSIEFLKSLGYQPMLVKNNQVVPFNEMTDNTLNFIFLLEEHLK